ncbi:MAG: hypothetical protein UT08_C0018G0026 [Candidatus Woesebacteria bacterium GW2011_GWB1_38_8]|uniref:Uncharacterized protein n=1 Tax=Candidatus Woesebacteria bacterium GW2011_GWB1_38_8 TaxID=1618570 RepID=A0A0G0L981_9BACT|nr:MAG: hypothetical protein UT08_C0018G0026 [Candidatus Woesebacteria bacterium GW2011_GWB1_38_8]
MVLVNKNDLGFAQFLIILAEALVIISAIAFFAFKNGQVKLPSTLNDQLTPSADITANWKTYETNVCKALEISFKYSSNIKVLNSTTENRIFVFWEGSDLLIGLGISYVPKNQLGSYEHKNIKSLLDLEIGKSVVTFQTGDWKEIFTRKPNENIDGKLVYVYEAPFGWGRPYPIKRVLIPQEEGYCEILVEYETLEQVDKYPDLLDQILSTFKFTNQ